MNDLLVANPSAAIATPPDEHDSAAVQKDWTIQATSFEAGLQDLAVSSPIFATWQRLFELDKSAPISLHPEHVMIELARATRTEKRPAWIIEAVSGGEAGALAVLLPKEIQIARAPGIGSKWKLQGYRLAGNRLLGLDQVDCRRALLDAVARRVTEDADFLLVEDLDTDHPLWQQLTGLEEAGFTAFLPKGIQARHRVRLPQSADAYWSQFSAKSRGNYRKKRRQLEPYRIVRVTEPGQVDELLAAMTRVSAASWQGRHLGRIVAPDEVFRRLLLFLAREGALRSYILWKDEQPIAFSYNTQFNGVNCLEETAYDLAHSESSPGVVLCLDYLDDLLAHDRPNWLDFGGGDAEYKRRFGNVVGHSGNLMLIPPGIRTLTLRLFLRTCRMFDRAVRSTLAATGLDEACHRWVRRSTEARS